MAKMTSAAKRETYVNNVNNGNINSKTMKVLHFIKSYELSEICNTYDMRQLLGMPHQTLTAIISNLLDLGIIKIAGETKHFKNTYSYYRYVSDSLEQKNNADKRRKEKFVYWLKQGLTEYSELMTPIMSNLVQSQLVFCNQKQMKLDI